MSTLAGQLSKPTAVPTRANVFIPTACLATVCLVLAVWFLLRYPLPPWPLAAALAAYSAALWRWPSLFLLVLPIVVPAYDLGLWTGWMVVGESDLFVLATIAILLIRTPPTAQDLHLTAAPAVVLLAFAASWLIATLIGLSSSLGAPYSDNPFLRPDNALRLVKPLAEALALLPFLRHRQRCHGDAATLLGRGLSAGLAVVTLIVAVERILFASILDIGTDYRVAGPFSSMRVGGGHIGAYAAMALPFSLTLIQRRPRWFGAILALLTCLFGGYTIAVTFARAAYAACLLGMTVTALGCLYLATRNRIRSAALGIGPITLVLAALIGAAGFTGMHARFAASAMDFLTRQDNWRDGLAVRDDTVQATLIGMGLGTYQRAMLERSPVNRPTDIVLRQDEAGAYVSMRVETPFYLGQKIDLPTTGPLNLTFHARSVATPAAIDSLVCDKVLLYSDNCRGPHSPLDQPNAWTPIHATIATDGVGSRTLDGLLRRPVELSLSGPIGHTIEIRDISLTDDQGHPMLVNGDFAHGLDRWIFTDDSHVSWRMLNEYLMLFFETGALGLGAYAALAALAIAGGIRALRSGSIAGASITGAVAAFLVSGLFDNVLEAPRVALLFFLVCLCALIQWEPRYDARSSEARASHS
jgi:hypothetical protein